MVDVRKLLEYNVGVRRKYFETFEQMSWKEFTRNREASFHSMRNIFVHTLNAMEYWLDFLEKKNVKPKKKYDEYKSFEDIRTYLEKDEKRLSGYLKSLAESGLKEQHTLKDDGGNAMKFSTEDVLVHMFEEEVHHRGELIALLWQIGIEPPAMGWKGL